MMELRPTKTTLQTALAVAAALAASATFAQMTSAPQTSPQTTGTVQTAPAGQGPATSSSDPLVQMRIDDKAASDEYKARKSDAKAAYKHALDAFAADAAADKTDAGPWLQQGYVLALLGRQDEARAMIDKTAKQFPNDPVVRGFVEGKQLDRILADPKFKENAL